MANTKVNDRLAAVRKFLKDAGDVYLHAHRDASRPDYSNAFIFTLNYKKGAIKTTIEVDGVVTNGYSSIKKDEEHYDPDHFYRADAGFWGSIDPDILRSAIGALSNDAEPTFRVSLDGATTINHVKAGLHGDMLYLIGKRPNGQDEKFLLEVDTLPHNTSRFGHPTHEGDSKGRGV